MGAVLEFDSGSYGYANGGSRVDILKDASVSFEKGVFYGLLNLQKFLTNYQKLPKSVT